jgi:hypothetical protein
MTPNMRQTIDALRAAGAVLGTSVAYHLDGRFHFELAGDWSLALSPETAGRFRLDVCHLARPVASLWCLTRDRERLERLVLSASAEAAALVG